MQSLMKSLLFTVLLVACLPYCSSYKCYICTWSPRTENKTDVCTTANFNDIVVNVFDGCIHGCEAVAVFDLNGKLENFYRNCLVKGKEVTDECQVEKTSAYEKRSCRCDEDLCNSGHHISLSGSLCLLGVVLACGLQRALG